MSIRANIDVPTIRLQGDPYQRQVVDDYGTLIDIDCSNTLNNLASNSGYEQRIADRVANIESTHLSPLFDGGFHGIDKKLKDGGELTFDEAYSAGTFVVMALNNVIKREVLTTGNVPSYTDNDTRDTRETQLMQATSLLSSLSTKESYIGLSPDEIAGVVASIIDLDTIVRTQNGSPILSFGGMGGDKGYTETGGTSKLFSLSTLSAIVLAVDGDVHKHHSYPNTSKVAGQSAIEAMGARSDFHHPERFASLLGETGLMMSSCHDTRTLHTLSHRLKGETINHLIGPLSYTIDATTEVNGMIGVNEKIHPETVIKTLANLSSRGFQKYGNSVAFFGTKVKEVNPLIFDESLYYKSRELREDVAIDEVAPPPYATVASFLKDGQPVGTYEIRAEDFFSPEELTNISIDGLLIPNTREAILRANENALAGRDRQKAMYLAMTAGLGIFVRKYLHLPDSLNNEQRRVNPEYLQASTQEAIESIISGKAHQKMNQYVAATQRYAGDV